MLGQLHPTLHLCATSRLAPVWRSSCVGLLYPFSFQQAALGRREVDAMEAPIGVTRGFAGVLYA